MSTIPEGTLHELVMEFGGDDDRATYRMLIRHSRHRTALLNALIAVVELHCTHAPGDCTVTDKALAAIAFATLRT